MKEGTNKSSAKFGGKVGLYKVVSISCSLAIGILGILFIAFAAHLYFTGGAHPYSRERVSEYLLPLAIPSLLTIALAIWSFILRTNLGASSENVKAKLSSIYRLSIYAQRINIDTISANQTQKVEKERKVRMIINIIFFSLSALLCVAAFVYIIFFAEFTVENLNADMLNAFAVSLPLLTLTVGVHVPRLFLSERSAERERLILSSAVKEGANLSGAVSPREIKGERLIVSISRLAVLGVAVAFIILGVFNGGMEDVLGKAVKICTECIGLG